MLVVLGDIHFSSSRDYFVAVSEAFLKWFKDWQHNTSGNELLLLGDIVHSSVNSGIVIDFVERMWKSSNFDCIHIIPGNHDLKRVDGVDQLAYEFLRNKPDVRLYDRAVVANIQGLSVLLMPHYIPKANEPLMLDYYSHAYEYFTAEYDLVAGHFMEEGMSFGTTDAVFNLHKLNTKHICLGHLHTRANPEIYVGSVYPNRTNENDYSRAAVLFEKDAMGLVTRREELLPTFCEFITVQYPEELPTTKALVPIYTITNCVGERLVKLKYGDVFIRKVMQGLDIPKKTELSVERSASAQSLNARELFDKFMRSQEPPLDRRVATLCLSSLETPTNLEYGSRNPSEAVLQA